MQKSYLTPKDLPVSFTGQTLTFGAYSEFLNPIKERKDTCTRYLANPLRALARLIYQIGVALLIAIPGICYHLYMANQKFEEQEELKQKWHFEAAKQDFFGFISLGGLLTLHRSFASAPKKAENFFLGDAKVKEEVKHAAVEPYVFHVNSNIACRGVEFL